MKRFFRSLKRFDLLRGRTSSRVSSGVYLLMILLFSLFGIKALFHPGFYTSHDGEHQVLRLYHFDKAVRDGQIPPRWADYQILNGHGYPLFLFSYQAPWIMAEPLRFLGISLTDTVKLMFVFTFVLSGLSMYFWLKGLFGELPAFVGSILYLWAPYRFSDIFVRASLGEATAFMFVPMIFYSLEKIKGQNGFIGMIIGAIGLSGLFLSHALASFVFIFPIVLYFLKSLFSTPRKRLYLKRASLLFILGFSLSAYYLLPAFFEKKFTKSSQIYPLMFADHFVTLKQLIYSRWGYGFSFPGITNDGMAFQIGAAHWWAVFLGVLTVIGLFVLRKLKKSDKRPFFLGIIFFLSFCLSILAMLKVSEPFWRFITQFIPFDFPWRFLGLSVFASSFLSAFAVFLLRKVKYKKIAYGLSLFLITLTFYANRNHVRVNQYVYLDDSQYEKITNSTSSYNELVPIWAKGEIYEKESDTVEVIEGTALVKHVEKKSDKIGFSVKNEDTGALLRITTLFFPGWKLFINGKKHEFNFTNSGMIEFKPPIGNSQVLLIFTKTPVRTVADIISFSTLVFLLLWTLKFQWR